MPVVSAYVICTAPRAGSTLLCLLLAATGIAGDPQSYFHAGSVGRWAQTLGVEHDPALAHSRYLADAFAAARTAGRAGTGVFGLRLQAPSLTFFLSQLAILHPDAPNDRARMETAFGPTRFIHLHRADKVDQAISRLKAVQTGLWHVASDGSEIERQAPPAKPVYDAEAIRAGIAQMEAWDRLWEGWFAREAITPLRIDYNALTRDPINTLGGVLEALGCDPRAANGLVVPTRKLADATNRSWARRFRAENERT
jgi:LPS sulfotransferase NodH